MALPEVDAVIVGAGAAGPIVAKQLVAAGWRVVLLERGKWLTPYDDLKDDLRNMRTTLLGAPGAPENEAGHPRVSVSADGKETIVLPSDGAYSLNAFCVGGGTLTYGAMAWRFHPYDFRMRSQYGALEGSTLADWPVSYDDLEPWYDQAEKEIGVSGDLSNNPHQGHRNGPLPMPPVSPQGREFEILDKAARRMGLHPFHIPMLRNSVPYNGRPACMRCRWCVGFACEVDAKNGSQNTVLPVALKTGLLELRTECQAKEIVVNEQGRATGVRYFDRSGASWEQPARVVISSCGAIESARLLLNSTSRMFPGGLGNAHDWVGRNLQGHAYSGAYGLFDEVTYDDLGPGATVGVSDFNHGTPGLRGGAMLCNEFIRLPINFLGGRPPDVPRWGQEFKDWARDTYRHTITVMGPTQEMPVFESRVQLDPKVRDEFGIPVARLSGPRHDHTVEIAKVMAGNAQRWLKEAGATKTWLRLSGKGTSGGQHQAGTCRMGDDPRSSVVDRNLRVHGIDNVFVIDGSVHVTNGGFNPVLTIMALAFRAGTYIAASGLKSRG